MRFGRAFIVCFILLMVAALAPPLIWTGVPYSVHSGTKTVESGSIATADHYLIRNWMETQYVVARTGHQSIDLLVGNPESRGPLVTEPIASWPRRVNRQLLSAAGADGIVVHEVGWPLRLLTYRRKTTIGNSAQEWKVYNAFLLHKSAAAEAWVPYTALVLNLILVASFALITSYLVDRGLTVLIHRRRTKTRQCVYCGYSLEPDSVLCPECGRTCAPPLMASDTHLP